MLLYKKQYLIICLKYYIGGLMYRDRISTNRFILLLPYTYIDLDAFMA